MCGAECRRDHRKGRNTHVLLGHPYTLLNSVIWECVQRREQKTLGWLSVSVLALVSLMRSTQGLRKTAVFLFLGHEETDLVYTLGKDRVGEKAGRKMGVEETASASPGGHSEKRPSHRVSRGPARETSVCPHFFWLGSRDSETFSTILVSDCG